MIINIKEFLTRKKKENNARRLEFLKHEGQWIRETMNQTASTSETTDILSNEDIATLMQEISPSGFVYRVELEGAAAAYRSITLANYRELVEKLGHMERDTEFLKALCLIDKCEEFADYDAMTKAFKITEYVIRHNKTNTPVLSYARSWIIEMRRYLEELNLL
jgi:hypothetical protein